MEVNNYEKENIGLCQALPLCNEINTQNKVSIRQN